MKISVIIPTRSRAEYLGPCLQSVVTAAGLAGCAVEILVSDNASDDDTADVVAGFDPALVRYRREPQRISMRANFEAALQEATGTHLMFIGDDDAVMPNGLRILREVFDTTGADAVNWTLPGYIWADPAAGTPGYAKLHPHHQSGRIQVQDRAALLARICAGQYRSYHDGIVTYHGCVSRRLIDAARAKSQGTYFWCSSPDVYAALRNLMVPDMGYVKVALPLTLGGASPRSNGRSSQQTSRRDGAAETSEFSRFIAEAENDPFNGTLPASNVSVTLTTLDALRMALRFEGRSDAIDTAAWAARIGREAAGASEVNRQEMQRHFHSLTGADLPLPETAPPVSDRHAPPPAAKDALRKWPATVHFVDGPAMADVARAAALFDQVCGMDRAHGRDPGALGSLTRVLGVARRARAAVRGHTSVH